MNTEEVEDLSIYNPDGSDLRKMQLRMLEMLTFIDSVCTKNDINFIVNQFFVCFDCCTAV